MIIPIPTLTKYFWRFHDGELLIGETKESVGLLPYVDNLFEKKENESPCRVIRAESTERAAEIINNQTRISN